MTAYAGNDFLLYIEDSGSPGTYLLVGGGKSCSVSFDGAPAISTDNIGQNAAAVIPSTMVCGCSVSGSGIFSDSEGEAQLLTAAFSADTVNFKIKFANLRQLVGSFYVTSFSRSGDMSAAEGYSFSLQGDDIVASSVGTQSGITWDSASMAPNGELTGDALTFSVSTGVRGGVAATSGILSGQKYFEVLFTGAPGNPPESDRVLIGVAWGSSVTASLTAEESPDDYINAYYSTDYAAGVEGAFLTDWGADAITFVRNTSDTYFTYQYDPGLNFDSGDVIGVAVDWAAKTVEFYVNGSSTGAQDLTYVSFGQSLSSCLTETWYPFVSSGNTANSFSLRTAAADLLYLPGGFVAMGG